MEDNKSLLSIGMGIGTVILFIVFLILIFYNVSTFVGCPSTFSTFNSTSNLCYNGSGQATGNQTLTGASYTTLTAGITGLGSVSGLMSWIGILVIVLMASFIFMFFTNSGFFKKDNI